MYNIYIVIGIIFPFIVNALGSLLVLFPSKKNQSNFALAFSAGVMMGASFWSLLIPAFNTFEKVWNNFTFFPVLLSFVFGGAFILCADLIFSIKKGERLKGNAKLFLAVTAHNVPEGLTVGFALGSLPIVSALGISFGIAVQNFPEGLAVAMLYKNQTKNAKTGFKMGVLSAVVEPVSGVIGLLLASTLTFIQPFALCFSAGAMVYVCISELIPKGCKSEAGVWAFNFGFCLMTALDIALG